MSLINQVLQNVEARQGATANDGWGAQVKPVLSDPGAATVSWVRQWGIVLVLLALIGSVLLNWPALKARFFSTEAAVVVATAPARVAVAATPAASSPARFNPTVEADDNSAWQHPQLTRSLFSAWQKPAIEKTPVAAQSAAAKPALSHVASRPQVEGEFSIQPADSAAANPVVTALEPPLSAANTVKTARNNEDESGPRGIVNKQIRPEQEVNLQIQRAVDQEQKGRLNEALLILRQVLTTSPQAEDARQLLAAYLFESRQEPEAVAVLQAGIKQFPGQTGLAKSLAKWQLAHAQPEAALQTLKPAANQLIQDGESQWMLAMAYQQTGQHTAALPHFDRATLLRPGHAQWIVAYAISLQAAGQPAQALQQLQQAYNLPLSDRLSEFVGQRIRQLGGTAVVRSE